MDTNIRRIIREAAALSEAQLEDARILTRYCRHNLIEAISAALEPQGELEPKHILYDLEAALGEDAQCCMDLLVAHRTDAEITRDAFVDAVGKLLGVKAREVDPENPPKDFVAALGAKHAFGLAMVLKAFLEHKEEKLIELGVKCVAREVSGEALEETIRAVVACDGDPGDVAPAAVDALAAFIGNRTTASRYIDTIVCVRHDRESKLRAELDEAQCLIAGMRAELDGSNRTNTALRGALKAYMNPAIATELTIDGCKFAHVAALGCYLLVENIVVLAIVADGCIHIDGAKLSGISQAPRFSAEPLGNTEGVSSAPGGFVAEANERAVTVALADFMGHKRIATIEYTADDDLVQITFSEFCKKSRHVMREGYRHLTEYYPDGYEILVVKGGITYCDINRGGTRSESWSGHPLLTYRKGAATGWFIGEDPVVRHDIKDGIHRFKVATFGGFNRYNFAVAAGGNYSDHRDVKFRHVSTSTTQSV